MPRPGTRCARCRCRRPAISSAISLGRRHIRLLVDEHRRRPRRDAERTRGCIEPGRRNHSVDRTGQHGMQGSRPHRSSPPAAKSTVVVGRVEHRPQARRPPDRDRRRPCRRSTSRSHRGSDPDLCCGTPPGRRCPPASPSRNSGELARTSRISWRCATEASTSPRAGARSGFARYGAISSQSASFFSATGRPDAPVGRLHTRSRGC